MNCFDLIIIMILGLIGYLGFRRGAIREITDLIILTISFIVALYIYNGLSSFLVSVMPIAESFVRAGTFFVIWFVFELLTYILAFYIFSYIPDKIWKSIWNKCLGIVAGVVKGFMVASLIIITMLILPFGKDVTTTVKESQIGKIVQKYTPDIERRLESIFSDVNSTISKFLTIESGSKERISLGYKYKTPLVDTVSATRMLFLINNERKKAGVPELTQDDKLTSVATSYAKDMLENGYLSHYNLDGKSPFDRMKAADISVFYEGENLAIASDVDIAMDGLMNSSGHKANVLSSDFKKIGVSVYDAGINGKIFVQEFTD